MRHQQTYVNVLTYVSAEGLLICLTMNSRMIPPLMAKLLKHNITNTRTNTHFCGDCDGAFGDARDIIICAIRELYKRSKNGFALLKLK